MELQPVQSPPRDREKVELYLSCKSLAIRDLTSLSDPFLVVSSRNPLGGWTVISQTEIKWNTINPDFTKTIQMDYIFERRQVLRVECRDADDQQGYKYDRLGECTFDLGNAVGMGNKGVTMDLLEAGKRVGSVSVRVEKVSLSPELITLSLEGVSLSQSLLCLQEQPFIIIQKRIDGGITPGNGDGYRRIEETGQWVTVYESEKLTTSHGKFKDISISASKLCGGDYDLPLKFQHYTSVLCWNYRQRGEFTTTVNQLLRSPSRHPFPLILPPTTQTGTLNLLSVRRQVQYTMLDYLRGGTELNLHVAIDFTGSNGHPREPSSLHHISNRLNDYQQAILGIGQILLNYDHDKMVPVHGFGASLRFPGMNSGMDVSHCFPCSGNNENTSGQGVDGIFQLYMHALQNVELSGPTYFSNVLQKVVEHTRITYMNDPNNYQVLLILTDGAIHDMKETIDWIVEGSYLPISIIIIGVGGADFSLMEQLDSDNQKLKGSRRTAQRDIVQFVPFRQFNGMPEELAAAVLAELPGQVVEFYRIHEILPKPPQPPSPPQPQSGPGDQNKNYPVPAAPTKSDYPVPPK